MPFDCPACGKQDSLSEHLKDSFAERDYANINIVTQDPGHTLDVLYLLPPYRCESCRSVVLRGKGKEPASETEYPCKLCEQGKLKHYENAALGELVIIDTFQKMGELTIDEALVCNFCGYLIPMEPDKEMEDSGTHDITKKTPPPPSD